MISLGKYLESTREFCLYLEAVNFQISQRLWFCHFPSGSTIKSLKSRGKRQLLDKLQSLSSLEDIKKLRVKPFSGISFRIMSPFIDRLCETVPKLSFLIKFLFKILHYYMYLYKLTFYKIISSQEGC